jgi:HEAT repeat protein
MRWLSCVSLSVILFASSFAPAQTKEDVPDLVKQLKDPDVFVRLKAAKQLGKVGAGARDAVGPLSEMSSKDADIDVRAVARNALDAIKVASMKDLPESAVEALKTLKKPGKAADKVKALEEISNLGPDGREATAELLDIMLQGPASAYQPYLDTLEKINAPLHKPVITLIVDKDNGKKIQALDELAKLGEESEPAAPVLVALYKSERGMIYKEANQYIMGKLIETMGKVAPRNKAVNQTIMSALANSNPSPGERLARPQAIEAAAAMDPDPKTFVIYLTNALADPSVRQKAAEALGKLGPTAKSALPVLTKLKLDADAGVRDAVTKAIDEIKGK